VNPVSLDQTAYAAEHGFTAFSLPQRHLLDGGGIGEKREEELIRGIRGSVENGEDLILSSVSSPEQAEDLFKSAREAGLGVDLLAQRIVAVLSRIVGELDDLLPRTTVMVIGGDTARGILQSMHVDKLYPVGEILPGVVVSKLRLGDQVAAIVTKAGGFGEENIIIRIKRYVAGAGK
jgi:uncharacterized protein YgbK (DUF1537 family)